MEALVAGVRERGGAGGVIKGLLRHGRFCAARGRLAVVTSRAGWFIYELEATTRTVSVDGPATGPRALCTGRPSS